MRDETCVRRAGLVRLWLALGAALAMCALGARPAAAQTCHRPSLRASADAHWRASVAALFASYKNPSYAGEFQGLSANASFLHPRVAIDLSVPYYRLVRNGDVEHGLGDIASDLRLAAYRSADEAWSTGPELAVSWPSGDTQRDLGMGHVMLMPGAWLKLQLPQLTLIVQVAYGRALGEFGTPHRHGSVGPIVNPMNRSEVEHALSVAYGLLEHLQLHARLWGAVPVAEHSGAPREALALGLLVWTGAFEVGLEQHLPLAGSPFSSKTLLSFGAQW